MLIQQVIHCRLIVNVQGENSVGTYNLWGALFKSIIAAWLQCKVALLFITTSQHFCLA